MNHNTKIITSNYKTSRQLESWMTQQMLQLQKNGKLNIRQEGSQQNQPKFEFVNLKDLSCLLYTSPSPRDATLSRMPSSA